MILVFLLLQGNDGKSSNKNHYSVLTLFLLIIQISILIQANTIVNNKVKLCSKAHLIKTVQFSECSDASLYKLAGPLIRVGIPFAKDFLVPVATMACASEQMELPKERCVEKQ